MDNNYTRVKNSAAPFAIYLPLILAFFVCELFADDKFKLNTLIDLSQVSSDTTQWLLPVENKADSSQILLANSDNSVFIVNVNDNSVIEKINLSAELPADLNPRLTAFTLHPSFAAKEQRGANIFYTAHVESLNEGVRALRLTNKKMSSDFAYDAVVNEWTVTDAHQGKYQLSKKREVLRLSLASKNAFIQQLAFNPNVKPWSNKYAFLHIVINSDSALDDIPLFSGTILRIIPYKLGLKSYTIPETNPHIKNKNIHDEIIVHGMQNISRIEWTKRTGDKIFASHQYEQSTLLSSASIGDNWQSRRPNHILLEQSLSKNLPQPLLYEGRNYPSLQKKVVYLDKKNNHWQLIGTLANKNAEDSAPPAVTWNLPQKTANYDDTLELLNLNQHNLVILNHSQQSLLSLTSSVPISNNEVKAPSSSTTVKSSSEKQQYLWIVLSIITVLALVMATIYYRKRRIKSKSILRSHYGNLKVNAKAQSISLFKRHQTIEHKALPFDKLKGITVYVNDTLAASVSRESDSPFTDKAEEALRAVYLKERRNKMAKTDIRKVIVHLHNSQGKNEKVCMYIREGNQRLTKAKFGEVVEQSINLCWHVSNIVCPEQTPKRRIKANSNPFQ